MCADRTRAVFEEETEDQVTIKQTTDTEIEPETQGEPLDLENMVIETAKRGAKKINKQQKMMSRMMYVIIACMTITPYIIAPLVSYMMSIDYDTASQITFTVFFVLSCITMFSGHRKLKRIEKEIEYEFSERNNLIEELLKKQSEALNR